MTVESIALPSGRRPVRNARAKSSLVHLPMPAGVMFAAGPHSGGEPGILPPENPSPWHPVHPVARYFP
jgi:hypothetical protein